MAKTFKPKGTDTLAKSPLFKPAEQAKLREERIRQRAYELYLARGGVPGDELRDWLQAEGEVRTGNGRS
ncbi:MAG: DUF2934 domain-containing protein [Planctomycetota bacterium]